MKPLSFSNHQNFIERSIQFVALVTVVYATYLALRYAGQPLLELFGFRQTQTALTSFWFIKEGFKFAYETPISGAPWAIPFEFPIYQAIVAVITKTLNTNLDKTGRIISFLFLLLCLIPVKSICQSLKLTPQTFYIFTGLLMSSPLYIFWGRSFMIETAAVFFAVAAIKYFIDFLDRRDRLSTFAFTTFISLSILQKATTGLPILAVLSFVFLFYEINRNESISNVITIRNILFCAILFALPLAIGYAWTHYTDIVKARNQFGISLTSSSLTYWNWGTFNQRISSTLYDEVLWSRIFSGNLSGIFGIMIIGCSLLPTCIPRVRNVVIAALAMGLLPLFLFTNLHLIHTYYQSANVIYLIFALSVALSEIGNRERPRILMLAFFVALVANNYTVFMHGYRDSLVQKINMSNSRDLLVADAIKQNLGEHDAFTLFGNDWSSSISYYTQHKSFAVPNFFAHSAEVFETPQTYLGSYNFGAVAVCPDAAKPTLAQLLTMRQGEQGWKTAQVSECFVSFPEKPLHLDYPNTQVDCTGTIDSAAPTIQKGFSALEVRGWTIVNAEQNILPSQVYVTLTNASGKVIYYDAVQYTRPDVTEYFKKTILGNAGFGRVIDTRPLSGHYAVGIVRVVGEQLQTCQFHKEIEVRAQ